jgi:hypothetical protein
VVGVQVHEPSVFAQGVEEGFSPNWPPGLTEELMCAGGAARVLGLTGMTVTGLAGALGAGAGAGALDLEGAGTSDLGGAGGAALGGAGAGALLEGAGAALVTGAELGLGATVVAGSGCDSPFFLTGMMFFIIIRRDWVTSRADSC